MAKRDKRTTREGKKRGRKSGVRAIRKDAQIKPKGKKKTKKRKRPMPGAGVRTLSVAEPVVHGDETGRTKEERLSEVDLASGRLEPLDDEPLTHFTRGSVPDLSDL